MVLRVSIAVGNIRYKIGCWGGGVSGFRPEANNNVRVVTKSWVLFPTRSNVMNPPVTGKALVYSVVVQSSFLRS
jgi:hypothetical protein